MRRTAKRQARRGRYAELLALASQGLCRLLGYDNDIDEREMNARAADLRNETVRAGKVRAA